jgi:trehalose 6-phosphate phosphatase
VELHPPIGEDKGTVVERMARGRSGGVFFAGDDIGDLPGFAALGPIRKAGRPTCSVAVASAEVPQEVFDAADHRVDDPEGLLEVLTSLLTAFGG